MPRIVGINSRDKNTDVIELVHQTHKYFVFDVETADIWDIRFSTKVLEGDTTRKSSGLYFLGLTNNTYPIFNAHDNFIKIMDNGEIRDYGRCRTTKERQRMD